MWPGWARTGGLSVSLSIGGVAPVLLIVQRRHRPHEGPAAALEQNWEGEQVAAAGGQYIRRETNILENPAARAEQREVGRSPGPLGPAADAERVDADGAHLPVDEPACALAGQVRPLIHKDRVRAAPLAPACAEQHDLIWCDPLGERRQLGCADALPRPKRAQIQDDGGPLEAIDRH